MQGGTPVPAAIAALARFPWDNDAELVTLTGADAVRTLQDYLAGKRGALDVQQWADALEGRDAIGREPGLEDELTEFLCEMATPEVAGSLTLEVAKRRVQLKRPQRTVARTICIFETGRAGTAMAVWSFKTSRQRTVRVVDNLG